MSEKSQNENKKQPLPGTSNDDPLSAQEMKALGEQVAMLLNSPVFDLAWKNMILDIQDQWMLTEPKEREKRESLHAELRMATRFMDSLMQSYYQAERIVEEEVRPDTSLLFDYDENSGFPGHDERSQ